MKRPTEIQARNYKEKDRHRSRERRPQGSREVGSQEEAGEQDTNSKTISGRGNLACLGRGEGREWAQGECWEGEAILGTGCSTSPWSWELCPVQWWPAPGLHT